MVRGAVWLLNDGVFSYSCLKAGRGALSARLSFLIGCYFSEDVLESSDVVEIFECVMLSLAKSLGIVNDCLLIVRERMYLAYRYFGQVNDRW